MFIIVFGKPVKMEKNLKIDVELKQTAKYFSSENGFIWNLAENCNQRFIIMANQSGQGKENPFTERKRKVGGLQ